ncbi:MAG TPA: 4-alpha-glucanotransferase [Kofleriaceae bacterium]|jgi:4-alpha-glucanotransferase
MRTDEGLARLGVKRLVLAIHDASFPSDPDEDIGRGSPATRAAARLFAYARELGFTAVQLGPQGQTSRGNPSPYDATIFSRHVAGIALDEYAGLADVSPWLLAAAGGPAQHAHAYDASEALVAAAFAAFSAGARAELRAPFDEFRAANASWLVSDALYAAISASHGGAGHRDWPADARDREALVALHAPAIARYSFGQFLAARSHARVRTAVAPLTLFGDMQIGYADSDAWTYAAAFLADYRMGAPPSRTNPEGQPWNYPVLDPDQLAGRAGALVHARAAKMFADYDGVRIDHPHGLVCPWVYRAHQTDAQQAVRDGARLYESPDLPDHPALAHYAIARPSQLQRAQPRYADGWVADLDAAQIARYSLLLDAIVAAADARGRSAADLSCEVLSTMPAPLAAVLARHGLGRWRVSQKANLADLADVYRMDQARPADWVMLGNHDTAPILAAIARWSPAQREAWCTHLSARLSLPQPARLVQDGFLATAMLAELLASPAETVSIFFADLFGYDERFNVPGLVSAENWTLRLPAAFESLHADRLARGAALDLPLAVELALGA